MKKFITLISLSIFLTFYSHAQNLTAYLSYATFNSPESGPYLETYLSVVGNTVNYVSIDNGKFQAKVEVTIVFSKDDKVVDFRKFNLLSPELEDTSKIGINFLDQQRFSLANGTYKMDIKIADLKSEEEPFSGSEIVEIYYPEDKITISGIQFIESFKKSEETSILTKNGYDLVPYVNHFYPKNLEKLNFYCEVYNTAQAWEADEKFLISYFIESYETGKPLGNYMRAKRETAAPVCVLFSQIDISRLASGNFNLVIEIRNRNNEFVTQNKVFFQRSNPEGDLNLASLESIVIANSFVTRITNADTLAEYIHSVFPIASESERVFATNQLKKKDLEGMQRFMLSFWQTRNNADPEKAWRDYYLEVIKADRAYGTRIKKGYQTDRGRVYLQYGSPNTISDVPSEPSAYPYEIWHYYQLGTQRNKKFVFYNPDLVTGDYELIHSDAFGEINDPRWKLKIYGRNTATNDPDNDGVVPHWGSKSEDYFNNPR